MWPCLPWIFSHLLRLHISKGIYYVCFNNCYALLSFLALFSEQNKGKYVSSFRSHRKSKCLLRRAYLNPSWWIWENILVTKVDGSGSADFKIWALPFIAKAGFFHAWNREINTFWAWTKDKANMKDVAANFPLESSCCYFIAKPSVYDGNNKKC